MQNWAKVREQVLVRDKFTCTYCGFRAKKFQRVHFKNGQPADAIPENLTTACIFCEQCFELESVSRMHSGLLIWLPELEQTDLNHFARGLYVARMAEDSDIAATAQRVMDQLLARRTEARKRIGTDDPMALATVMVEQMDDATYAKRAERFGGLRLLPLPRRLNNGDAANDQFPTIIEYWTSLEGPFMAGTPKEWLRLAEKITT